MMCMLQLFLTLHKFVSFCNVNITFIKYSKNMFNISRDKIENRNSQCKIDSVRYRKRRF